MIFQQQPSKRRVSSAERDRAQCKVKNGGDCVIRSPLESPVSNNSTWGLECVGGASCGGCWYTSKSVEGQAQRNGPENVIRAAPSFFEGRYMQADTFGAREKSTAGLWASRQKTHSRVISSLDTSACPSTQWSSRKTPYKGRQVKHQQSRILGFYSTDDAVFPPAHHRVVDGYILEQHEVFLAPLLNGGLHALDAPSQCILVIP